MQAPRCSKPECSNIEMQRIEGVYALTLVTQNEKNISFNPASGVPVVCYLCPTCGKVTTYSAKLLGEIT